MGYEKKGKFFLTQLLLASLEEMYSVELVI